MPRIPFASLPDDARLWVFGSARPLESEERAELLAVVDRFLDDWRAHGTPLTGAREWRDDRFLMVAVDEASVPPSGCSIDAMVGVLRELEGRLGTVLVDHAPVFYRDRDGAVRRVARPEFRRLAVAGEVDGDTPVFDTTLVRVGAVRAGEWERAARDSWHGRAFLRTGAPGASPAS
jgi:hypothetical protein